MKRNYKLLSSLKQGLFALALTAFSGTAYSQTTYTLNYTGSVQTMNLLPGTYNVEIWGADGGSTTGTNPNAALVKFGGKGGYSKGTLTLAAPTTASIYVGGKGNTEGNNVPGGFNGGGNSGTGSSGVCGSGGGASDIRIGGNALTDRQIVAGGGGAAGFQECNGVANVITGGHGGGLIGGDPIVGAYAARIGHGGTQSAGGASGTDATYAVGNPGTFGLGGSGGTSAGSSAGAGGGGGGWYGGGSGSNGSYCAAGGGGGSSYIGGVTNGATIMYGTAGFVTNPDVTGNGLVLLTALCDLNITSTSSIICTGAAVTLSTNAIAGTYTWSTGNTTTNTIVVSPTITTTYTLGGQGTTPNGCLGSAAFIVTVNNTPTVTINSSTTSACQGQSITLTASGANTYVWNNSVTNGVAFAPLATALYTVTGTNACGTSTAGVTVSISALPVTAVASSTLFCAGSPATLTAGGATTYTWLPGPGTQSTYIVNPTANTIYTVTGKTGNCQGIATLAIQTKTLPTLSIATATNAICYGNTANLTAMGDAVTYSWSVAGQTGPSISVSPTNTSVYTVTGTNVVNCTRSVSQVITVNPNPYLILSVSNPVVCVGGSSTLTASGTNTYTWGGGVNTFSNAVNPTASAVYSVTGTNTLTGCNTTATVAVDVFEPVLGVSSNTSICKGTNVVIGATGAISYTWTNNGSSAQSLNVSPTANTTYTVSGTVVDLQSSIGCNATNTIEVNVFALPSITAVSSQTAICRGAAASLTVDGAGTTGTYTWTGGLGNTPVISVTPILDQNYSVSGTDVNGCKGTATVQVLVSPCTNITTIEEDKDQLIIFPNPSSGEVTITSEQPMQLKLINELGQEVQVINITGTEKKATLKNLTSGVYFIISESGNVKQKIVVTK